MLKPLWLGAGGTRGRADCAWGGGSNDRSQEPPQIPRGEEDGGRASWVPPPPPRQRGRSPRKRATPDLSKGGGAFREAKGDPVAPGKPPPHPLFGLAVASPGPMRRAEMQLKRSLQPAGRSAPNARKSPHCGRWPVSRDGEAPPSTPQFSAPQNSHPGGCVPPRR